MLTIISHSSRLSFMNYFQMFICKIEEINLVEKNDMQLGKIMIAFHLYFISILCFFLLPLLLTAFIACLWLTQLHTYSSLNLAKTRTHSNVNNNSSWVRSGTIPSDWIPTNCTAVGAKSFSAESVWYRSIHFTPQPRHPDLIFHLQSKTNSWNTNKNRNHYLTHKEFRKRGSWTRPN